MAGGRQYIVVPVGGSYEFRTAPGYVALAIPQPDESLPAQAPHRHDADHAAYYDALDAVDSGDVTLLGDLLAQHPELVKARGFLDELYPQPFLRGATLLHHVAGYPLRAALPDSVVAVARLLLDAGADPSAMTLDGSGTLSFVFESEQAGWVGVSDTLIQLLLEAGADPNERNGMLLWYALRREKIELSETLIEHGARIDLRAAAGLNRIDQLSSFFNADTSLTAAAHSGYRPNWPRLDDRPAPAEETLGDAMVLAVRFGNLEAVEWLLDHGVDPHLVSPRWWWHGDEGAPPLHHAAGKGHLEIARLLLARGADPGMGNQWGDRALKWARWRDDNEEMVKLLEEAESD